MLAAGFLPLGMLLGGLVASAPARAANGSPEPTRAQAMARAIASDTFGRHVAIPRGVPAGYSWREDADTNRNRASHNFQRYGALNVWGQVFATRATREYNVRLQARDPRLYFFNGRRWTRASFDPGRMGGAYYIGSFRASKGGRVRNDGHGAYSVSLSTLASGRWDAWHWWWDGMYPRVRIPSGTRGILVSTDMRLIPDHGKANMAGAKFITTACADLFRTPHTTVGPGGMNPGIPEGRMTWVTGRWQHFYDTTLDLDTLRRHPPRILGR